MWKWKVMGLMTSLYLSEWEGEPILYDRLESLVNVCIENNTGMYDIINFHFIAGYNVKCTLLNMYI